MAKKKTCFIIGPIGEPESDTRKWADKVFKHIIKPAVEACGYETPVRADHIPRPGAITTDVIQHILNDDLVIADLTGPNANAYYELAVRHARRKPFIHLIRKGEESPFDTKDLRTIPIGTEVDDAESARDEIQKYIPEVEQLGDQIFTQISQVAEWELMKASGDEQQKTLADILPRLAGIERYMNVLTTSIEEIGRFIKATSERPSYRPLSDILSIQDATKPIEEKELEKFIAEATIKEIKNRHV